MFSKPSCVISRFSCRYSLLAVGVIRLVLFINYILSLCHPRRQYLIEHFIRGGMKTPDPVSGAILHLKDGGTEGIRPFAPLLAN